MPTQTTLSRVESFPFDSRSDGYDAEGYPVYDRAVGASMLRETFKKFFSDGVFPSPGDALQIAKGSGLTVTIQPGIFIIRGAMGGYLTDAHSLTLDTAAPQGNVCYGVMLRYDETEQCRSCYLRVVRGDAAGTPTPPAPDQSTPGVMEYRLGYVTVPTGATDLSSATVTNERGLAVCPYAAPFEEIDMSEVTADAKAAANEALTQLLDYFETYRGSIDAALSGEEATYLQQQINQLAQQISDVNLSEAVDGVTIEYATDLPDDIDNKLRVKDGGITGEKIADYAIDSNKFTAELQIKLDVVDTSDWGFDQYYGFVGSLSGDDQNDFIGGMDMSAVNSWNQSQKVQFVEELEDSSQKTFMTRIDLASTSWADLQAMSNVCSATGRSGMLGRSKNATLNGSAKGFLCVSVDHYEGVDGLVLMYRDSSNNHTIPNRKYESGNYQVEWSDSDLFHYTNTTFVGQLGSDLSGILKECPIPSHAIRTGSAAPAEKTVSAKAWTPSLVELIGSAATTSTGEGTQFDWFAQGNSAGTNTIFWLRTAAASSGSGNNNDYVYRVNGTSGSYNNATLVSGDERHDTAVFVCI